MAHTAPASTPRDPLDHEDQRFDWWLAACSTWMVVGLYLDGWAHRHLHDLDSFFTPWHGVLYSGFLACAGLLAWQRARSPGIRSRRDGAAAVAYRLSFIGVVIFLSGGVGDLIWHTLLGVEADLDALLSPTHLMLAAGGVLILAGPFYAEWLRGRRRALTLTRAIPMLVSLTLVLSVMTFFTQFAHPLVEIRAAGQPPDHPFIPQALGIASILIQATMMSGAVLLAVRRWELPFGSLALLMAINGGLLGALEGRLGWIWLGLAAGLAADGLGGILRPSPERPLAFRVFAAAVPASFYTLYFALLAAVSEIWWSIPMWTGSIILAGAIGWLLSLLVVPPVSEGGS